MNGDRVFNFKSIIFVWLKQVGKKRPSKPLPLFFGKIKKLGLGFSLVEMIVAVGIFVIVVVTIVDLYLIYSKAHNLANQRQKILTEAGFFLAKITQEVRVGEIIYQGTFNYGSGNVGYYSLDGDSGIAGKEIELVLTDALGNEVIYVFDETGNKVCPSQDDPEFNQRGIYKYTVYQGALTGRCEPILNLPNAEVVDLGFYISPSTNPYPTSDADCKSGSTFNGYYCSCIVNGDCYSNSCLNGFCEEVKQQPRLTISLVIDDQSRVSAKPIFLQTTASSRLYKK